MDCLKCELVRAKLKAKAWTLLGLSLGQIAIKLSECYGVFYFVKNGNLYRGSYFYPHEPHLIKEGKKK